MNKVTERVSIRLWLLCLLLGCWIYLSGCSGCSRSGSHQPRRSKRSTADQPTTKSRQSSDPSSSTADVAQPTLTKMGGGSTEVKMEKQNGVYVVPVTINGHPMRFILDTGASLISISATEAGFMFKQGTITEDDIVGQARFQDANGNISPGDLIRLKSVQIGDRVLENVTANVVRSSKAPLLLGQSVLSKFGKISVDYRRNVVTFD